MVQLLSLQLQGAVAYLARDPATRAFRVDAVHLGLALHAAKLLDAGGHAGMQHCLAAAPCFDLTVVCLRARQRVLMRRAQPGVAYGCIPWHHYRLSTGRKLY
jgi:hypothetical protein